MCIYIYIYIYVYIYLYVYRYLDTQIDRYKWKVTHNAAYCSKVAEQYILELRKSMSQ